MSWYSDLKYARDDEEARAIRDEARYQYRRDEAEYYESLREREEAYNELLKEWEEDEE